MNMFIRAVFTSIVLILILPQIAAAANELTDARGGSGGAMFLDIPASRIAGVRIRAGKYVDSIQLGYRKGNNVVWGPRHGGGGGKLYEIKFKNGENIQEIGGRHGKYLDAIYIKTNRTTYATRGGNGGKSFKITGRIKGIWGRSGSLVDALGVVKTMTARPPAPNLKISREILQNGSVKTTYSDGSYRIAGPGTGSSFTTADGQTLISLPSTQVPAAIPPSPPGGGVTSTWLNEQSKGLLGIISTLVGNDQQSIDYYLAGEGDLGVYEQIAKRRTTLGRLVRQ